MNVNLLIDAIVRQTTVLIAQLATAAGARAALAHTANSVFLELVRELKEQGLGNKVIADMFGLTLRTYHNRIARLAESTTDRGHSLWEALLGYVQQRGPVSRHDVLRRFSGDDEASVRGVLKDLVDSGMVFRTGRGDYTVYRAAGPDDARDEDASDERLASFVWVTVYRSGPTSAASLCEKLSLSDAQVATALERLLAQGRVECTEQAGEKLYGSTECVIPLGSSAGWEAAVWDHYQAMVTAICSKLRQGKNRALPGEWTGGSTYTIEVWDGHPLHDEVVNFLQATRERAVDLRKRVGAHGVRAPDGGVRRVTVYVGQSVLEEGESE